MNESSNPNPDDLNRRHFLKTTSTAVVGGTFLGGLSACKSGPEKKTAAAATVATVAAATHAHASSDDTIKIALIGCGGRGSGAANQALSTDGKVRLVAMCDAFPDRIDSSLGNLKNEHKEKVEVNDDKKFTGFDGYKQAIAQADVVILATPPGFRPIHFEEAVRQGKHIFMEKPVAVDAPGVRRVLAAAEEAKKKNLKIGVGLQRHHQIGYIETMKRLHDGAIGDIVAMRCYWNGATPWVKTRESLDKQSGRKLTEMEYQMRNWYYFVWLSGDHICEQHIHNLDVINWVKKGYPVRAHGMGGVETRKGKDYGEIFDHHAVEFEYADGSRCASQCRHQLGTWSNVSEHVVGTKGSCDVGGHTIRGDNAWRFREKGKDPYQVEHDDLFAAIRKNQPYNEAENGAKSTMTSILGRMATYSGKVIDWEEAINSKINVMPERFAWDANPQVLPDENGWYPHAIPGKTVTV